MMTKRRAAGPSLYKEGVFGEIEGGGGGMTNAEAIEILKSRRMCAAYVDSKYVDSVLHTHNTTQHNNRRVKE